MNRTAYCRQLVDGRPCESIACERAVIGKGFVFEHFPLGCNGVPHRFVVPYAEVSVVPEGQHIPRSSAPPSTDPRK